MDFQLLAKGIALAGCAIGAGCETNSEKELLLVSRTD